MAMSALARALPKLLGLFFLLIPSYFIWGPNDKSSSDLSSSPKVNEYPSFNSNHHLAGLVLARGGSKGIPHKNMVDLNGKPLLSYALEAMIESEAFSSIWISTDDAETGDYVKTAYPSIRIHDRADYTATDDATSLIAVQEFLSFHPEIDAIGLVQATSPFVDPSHLRMGASLLLTSDSAFAATRSHQLRWKGLEEEGSFFHGKTVPLNFDPKRRPRRQDWPGEMVENGMFYFTMRDLLVQEHTFQGKRTSYVEIPRNLSLEIDTPEDLELAEFLMKNRKKKYEATTTEAARENFKINPEL